jgi:transposase
VKQARTTRLFAGLDWASKTHAVCVVDDGGAIRARFEIPNSGKTFAGLVKRLIKLGVAGVAIERCDGPLVEALLDAGLRVVVITPRQVKGLRSRYTGSGAKSDTGDAYLLADVLRTDGHRLMALTQDSDATQVLRALSRTRKQLVESRVGLTNQLRAVLERVFPGAVGLFARLDSDVAIAFLRRYPTQHAATGLTQARFAAFLRRVAYRGRRPVEELFARVHDAPPAGLTPIEADGHAAYVLALLRTIETT